MKKIQRQPKNGGRHSITTRNGTSSAFAWRKNSFENDKIESKLIKISSRIVREETEIDNHLELIINKNIEVEDRKRF